MPIINLNSIQQFSTYEWSESHGASDKTLGGGLLYYFLTYITRAKVCVCIGSGGGFVPSIMRQAQKENNIDGSITILIDANIKDITNLEVSSQGTPKWVNKPKHPFNICYPEVKRIIKFSDEAIDDIDFEIDYLHLDGDHSYEQVKKDFENYSKKVKKSGFITFHDIAKWSKCGVRSYINELRQMDEYDIINIEDEMQIDHFTGISLVQKKERQ